MPRSLSFCSFCPFSVVLLTLYYKEICSSKDLTIFIISCISLFEIINVDMSDPNFFWIAAFVADTAAVDSNGTKTFLAYGVSILFINGK